MKFTAESLKAYASQAKEWLYTNGYQDAKGYNLKSFSIYDVMEAYANQQNSALRAALTDAIEGERK